MNSCETCGCPTPSEVTECDVCHGHDLGFGNGMACATAEVGDVLQGLPIKGETAAELAQGLLDLVRDTVRPQQVSKDVERVPGAREIYVIRKEARR